MMVLVVVFPSVTHVVIVVPVEVMVVVAFWVGWTYVVIGVPAAEELDEDAETGVQLGRVKVPL